MDPLTQPALPGVAGAGGADQEENFSIFRQRHRCQAQKKDAPLVFLSFEPLVSAGMMMETRRASRLFLIFSSAKVGAEEAFRKINFRRSRSRWGIIII